MCCPSNSGTRLCPTTGSRITSRNWRAPAVATYRREEDSKEECLQRECTRGVLQSSAQDTSPRKADASEAGLGIASAEGTFCFRCPAFPQAEGMRDPSARPRRTARLDPQNRRAIRGATHLEQARRARVAKASASYPRGSSARVATSKSRLARRGQRAIPRAICAHHFNPSTKAVRRDARGPRDARGRQAALARNISSPVLTSGAPLHNGAKAGQMPPSRPTRRVEVGVWSAPSRSQKQWTHWSMRLLATRAEPGPCGPLSGLRAAWTHWDPVRSPFAGAHPGCPAGRYPSPRT